MTNYNDGKWHGWNGGECPVHPKTTVEGYWRHDEKTVVGSAVYNRGYAYGLNFAWDGETKLKLFRVVKEHREPRECWAVGKHMHDSLAEAETFRAQVDANYPGRGYLDTPITHWREVV